MYVPRTRERVRLAGRKGVFLVVWVDEERQEADLIKLGDSEVLEESVPFSKIEAYLEDVGAN